MLVASLLASFFFTSAALAQNPADWELALDEEISSDSISAFHDRLTRRPHRAGTEGARVVATYLGATLAEAGLEVETVEYYPYLSSPRSIAIDRIAPTPASLEVVEPPDPRDPTSAHAELEPGFVGYSASGTVTGDVVYVGYGLPADYEELGVNVEGKIALARYGRSHRAVKVHTAQERGALGVILYSDPEDDGAGRGATWPVGPWRAESQVQRGNAKFSWLWHGDPLTPGTPATRDADRIDASMAPTLPRIPVAPISAREATKLRVEGARIRLSIEMDDGLRPIRNVIAKIPGVEEPERWIVFGTHHDAWTFGGVDPGSAAATLMEVARALKTMTEDGWRPRRSIVFAFWDAEEYGLVGSTEYAEDHIDMLRERVAVYVNTDMYNGTRFVAGGTPTLRDFVKSLAADMPEVTFDAEDLNALGSGADFVPFQDFVGLPTLSMEFLFEGGWGFGTYHSNYDSRYWMTHHGDTDFAQGVTLARLLGRTALRLADAAVLPYRFSYYARKLTEYVELAESWSNGERRFEGLRARAVEIRDKSLALEQRIAAAGDALPDGLNDGLMRLEHTLIDESEPARERWYRHVVYGWNIYALYSGQPFPGLSAAITRGAPEDVSREAARIEAALDRLSRGLDALISSF